MQTGKSRAMRWIAVVGGLLLVIALAKNVVANALVTGGVKAITGLDLRIGRIDVGILRSALGVHDLVLHNPDGYPDLVMIDLPEIYVHYDIGALLRGRVHLPEVRLNLKEFVVVKSRDGRLNLDALKVVQDSKGQAKPAASTSKPGQMQIDLLTLKIGKVIYKDYSLGPTPVVKEFALNLDERYEGITNPTVLAGLIVSRALMNTTIASLTGLDLGPMQALVSGHIERAKAIVGTGLDAAKGLQTETTRRVQESAGQLTDAAKSATKNAGDASKAVLGTASDTVKSTTETIKKVLPFGQ